MKTPLHQIHRAQGAEFTDYQGWEMADRFTNPEEEYRAVRSAVGLIDVSHRATFRVGGPERVDFLHRILSNDVKTLEVGRGCQAVLLTAKGKLIGAMTVLASSEAMWIETEPAARQSLFDKLEMYKLLQKVELEDVTQAVAKVLVQGPRSTEFLCATLGQSLALAEDLQHQEHQVEGATVRVIRAHETGEVGYKLIAPASEASHLWELLSRSGADLGLKAVGFRAFNLLRVEAGIPWYGVDMDDTTFPQEVRMDHALDWDKGCYIGYEPVARIKFRGHVNKKLVGLKLSASQTTPPQSWLSPGSKILESDQPIGHITSWVYSPRLNASIALGRVRREFIEPGTEVRVETASGATAATVAELPFYSRMRNGE